MRVECLIDNASYLTKDKTYEIRHIYDQGVFDQIEILCDKGFYMYYPKSYFRAYMSRH